MNIDEIDISLMQSDINDLLRITLTTRGSKYLYGTKTDTTDDAQHSRDRVIGQSKGRPTED